MQEDSLLSNISNISYHGNNQDYNGNEFFDKSMPAGQIEPPIKQQPPQQEVNINDLGFNQAKAVSSSKDHPHIGSACYWTSGKDNGSGQSHNASDYDMLGKSESDFMVQSHQINHADHNQCPDTKKETQLQQFKESDLRLGSQKQIKCEEEPRSDPIGTAIKNQTKNIPKNYGKAIITYIEKDRQDFQKVLDSCGVEYEEFMEQLGKKKKSINTIANLRDLWIEFKYSKCMRILSNQFLRKHALHYIFNSRICNYTSHIKYRKRLQEAVESPGSFRHIKEY